VTFASDSTKNMELAPGARATVKYEYTVTEANAEAGSVVNTATAAGKAADGSDISETSSVTVETKAVEPEPEPTPTPTDDDDDPTPTPTPTDDDDDPTPTPTPTPTPGGGGTPRGTANVAPAPGPAPAPAPDETVIPDDPTPEVEPEVDIVDPEPPLAEGTWALLNLLSAIVTALGAAVALFRKKEEEDDENDPEGTKKPKNDEEEEKDNRGKKMLASKLAGAVAGVASPITFLLTEDMSNTMALTDKWTILMLAMLAGQVVAAVLNKRASKLDDEEEENAEAAAN